MKIILFTIVLISVGFEAKSSIRTNEIQGEYELLKNTDMKFSLSTKRSKDSSADISVTFSDGYTDTIILGKHYFNEQDRTASRTTGEFFTLP